MSGHNKWSKIKRKKASTDAAKSKIFGKYARLIAAESKKVGGDPNAASLRDIIERAKKENMPLDNIERAVKKGAGGGTDMEAVTYETYGPGGAAIIIETMTDNRNRTAQEIKQVLAEYGAELAAPGSAAWAFEKAEGAWQPTVTLPVYGEEKERLDELVEALRESEDVEDVYTNAE